MIQPDPLPEGLADLADPRGDIDKAIADTVLELTASHASRASMSEAAPTPVEVAKIRHLSRSLERAQEFSWSEVGRVVRITRQAAQQKYGRTR